MKLKSFFCVIVALFFLLSNFAPSATANSLETRKDTPSDFDQFLESCSQEEKSLLMNSLRAEKTNETTAESIKKALVYRAYNKATYPFRGHSDVDYHSIVQWAAGECEMSKEQIATLSTFFLERKIVERYFSDLWDVLSPEQKSELLQKIGEPKNSQESILSILSRNSRLVTYSFVIAPSSTWLYDLASELLRRSFVEKDIVCAFIITVHSIKTQKKL